MSEARSRLEHQGGAVEGVGAFLVGGVEFCEGCCPRLGGIDAFYGLDVESAGEFLAFAAYSGERTDAAAGDREESRCATIVSWAFWAGCWDVGAFGDGWGNFTGGTITFPDADLLHDVG